MKTATEHYAHIDRAVDALAKTRPPTMHKVFDKTYVIVTPELGTLLNLIYLNHDFETREGIRADE